MIATLSSCVDAFFNAIPYSVYNVILFKNSQSFKNVCRWKPTYVRHNFIKKNWKLY